MKKSNHYSSDASQSRRLHHTRAYLGVLSEVLPNWPTVRLGEVLRLDLNRVPVDASVSYPMVGVLSFGRGLFEREPIENGKTSYRVFYRLNAEHVVMSQLFGWEGALALSENKYAGRFLSPQFPTFLCNNELLDRNFLGWLMKRPTFWQDLGSRASGMGDRRRTLTPDALFKCEIPLPPLAEQRRIVARIEQLAGQIAEARSLRQQAAEEADAVMMSASANLFEPKRDWQIKSVGAFCESPQYGYTESATVEPIGPRFLRITDIQDNRVNWDSVPYCRCAEPAKYLLKPNDLVFARTGATTGKSFVIRECPEAVFASYLIRLRVRNRVSIDYLYRYFQSPGYWAQISDEKKGTGQPNLNGSKLEKLKVPIAPMAEQRRIVAELDALQAEVDKLKALQAATAAELDALLPSILDKAFRGEL
jgi:restriction endonuclease S subunit